MAILSDLSADLAAIVATAGQAVVRVEGHHRFPGSGTLWSSDGLVITAHHNLRDDEGIRVGINGGKSSEATLVGRDPTTDLALLRVSAKLPDSPEWAGPEDLRVGHLVLSLGRPGRTVRAGPCGPPWE